MLFFWQRTDCDVNSTKAEYNNNVEFAERAKESTKWSTRWLSFMRTFLGSIQSVCFQTIDFAQLLTASKIVNRKCLRLTSDDRTLCEHQLYSGVSPLSLLLSLPLLTLRHVDVVWILRVHFFLFLFPVCCRRCRSRRRWRPPQCKSFIIWMGMSQRPSSMDQASAFGGRILLAIIEWTCECRYAVTETSSNATHTLNQKPSTMTFHYTLPVSQMHYIESKQKKWECLANFPEQTSEWKTRILILD